MQTAMTPEDLVGLELAIYDDREKSNWPGFRVGVCVAVDNGPRKGFRRLKLRLGYPGSRVRVWFPSYCLFIKGHPTGISRDKEIISCHVSTKDGIMSQDTPFGSKAKGQAATPGSTSWRTAR
jgi:hypothetical protein